jgi:mannose-1-phosphate guanylyltransferase
MLPIVERPMLERVVEHLGTHGVDEVVLSLQYLPDAFKDAYPEETGGVRLRYVVEPTPLDTAGAIRFAAHEAGIDETFVVMNGDILTDLDLQSLVAFHRAARAEGTLRLYPVADPSRFGVVTTDPDGRVLAFVEKPGAGRAPTNLINAGTYVLEAAFLDRVPLGERVSIEVATFPQMAKEGRLFAMAETSYWLDAGTPEAFLRANFDLLDGTRAVVPYPGAVGEGGVWRAGRADVDGDVVGPSFLGAGTTVERGATAVASVLGASTLLRPGSQVAGSVLMAGVVVEPNARVEEAILGAGVRVGAACQVQPGSIIGFGAELEPGRVVAGERVAQ